MRRRKIEIHLGNLLRIARIKKGYTLKDLEKSLDCTYCSIARIEAGSFILNNSKICNAMIDFLIPDLDLKQLERDCKTNKFYDVSKEAERLHKNFNSWNNCNDFTVLDDIKLSKEEQSLFDALINIKKGEKIHYFTGRNIGVNNSFLSNLVLSLYKKGKLVFYQEKIKQEHHKYIAEGI